MNVCMYIDMYVFIYIYIHILCIHIYLSMYIYIYIHVCSFLRYVLFFILTHILPFPFKSLPFPVTSGPSGPNLLDPFVIYTEAMGSVPPMHRSPQMVVRCKGILPKMAETFRLRSCNKLPRTHGMLKGPPKKISIAFFFAADSSAGSDIDGCASLNLAVVVVLIVVFWLFGLFAFACFGLYSLVWFACLWEMDGLFEKGFC